MTEKKVTRFMFRFSPSLGIALLTAFPALQAEEEQSSEAEGRARTAWFEEARFGMFIHWGVYSLLGRGEWVMYNERIQVPDYEKLYPQFNPTEFNAAEWVALAKEAGMRYIVITTKHHDGFCMFDSALTDYTIRHTPFQRDVIGELTRECQRQGVKIGYYHSLLDWHHPDYLPRRPWEVETRPAAQADFSRFIQYLHGQLRELCTNYGKIDVIWFDGGWEHSPEEWRSAEMVAMIRQLQPQVIINDRSGLPEDFSTPEQQVPAAAMAGRLWETCMTINDHWGYARDDHNHKSVRQLVQTLVDIASKGGNLLLNVGPTPQGTIQPEHVARLRQMGAWLKIHGESIYGTQASPFPTAPPWGRLTVRPRSAENPLRSRLYLHVFDWPTEPILLSGLQNQVLGAFLLRDGQPIPFLQAGLELTLDPPPLVPDPYDTVLVLEIEGIPAVDRSIHAAADGSLVLPAAQATVHGSTARYESGPERDNIGFWVDPKDTVSWEFTPARAGVYRVDITYACEPGTGGSEFLVAIGDRQLAGTVRDTGGWGQFITETLGEITLPEGRQTLTVIPQSMPHGAVMNLQRITLTPRP
jgi:alpha-L-fucosidase